MGNLPNSKVYLGIIPNSKVSGEYLKFLGIWGSDQMSGYFESFLRFQKVFLMLNVKCPWLFVKSLKSLVLDIWKILKIFISYKNFICFRFLTICINAQLASIKNQMFLETWLDPKGGFSQLEPKLFLKILYFSCHSKKDEFFDMYCW